MDNLKAIAEAEKRLLEDTIKALREKLENSAADTLAQIENLRADQDETRGRLKVIFRPSAIN